MTTNAVRSSDAKSGSPSDETRAPGGPADQTAAAGGDATGSPDADAVWSRFEAIIAARSTGRRPDDAPSASAAARLPVAEQSLSLVAMPPASRAIADFSPAMAMGETIAPQARKPRGAWLYRLQGAVLAAVLALGVVAALRFLETPAPEAVATPPAAGPTDPSSAFADAFAQTARDEALAAPPPPVAATPDAAAPGDDAPEAEVIARIAAADPPYRVVLHIAPDASPREVARLDTAIRAWGFSQPEQQPAADPVTLPEVVFHSAGDREAATILARIADRILAEAVLTPPPEGALSAAAAPESAGRLDVYVMTR